MTDLFEELKAKYLSLQAKHDQEQEEINRIEQEKNTTERNEKIRLDVLETQKKEDIFMLEHIKAFWLEFGIEEEDMTAKLLWNIIGWEEWAKRQGVHFDQTRDYKKVKNAMIRLNQK